jgi:hypothetical protein
MGAPQRKFRAVSRVMRFFESFDLCDSIEARCSLRLFAPDARSLGVE